MAGAAIPYTTLVMSPSEGRLFVFALDNVPELLARDAAGNAVTPATIASARISGPGNTPLVGVTAGTPTVLAAAAIVDSDGNTVAAGKGVSCAIYAPSSAGGDYIVECRATLSNGAIVVVAGKISVRIAI